MLILLKGFRMSKLHKHYSEVPQSEWKWPNFRPQEIASKDNGELLIDEHAMDCLQRFREIVAVPVVINSAYRSEAHNKSVGGVPGSMHRKGRAFDVRIKSDLSREKIHTAAKIAGFTGFGDYNTFVHIDTGAARTWDNRKKV